MTSDQRASNVVFIGGTNGTTRRSPGFLHGDPTAPMNRCIKSITAAVDEYHRRDADLRASRAHMTAGEIEVRRRELQSLLTKQVDAAANEVLGARSAAADRMRDATAVRPGRDVEYYQASIDRELRESFNALSPKDRAVKLHQMREEPVLHLAMVDALLRAPRELTGLTHEDVTTLRVRNFAALRSDEFAALDVERQQINTALNAVHLAAAVLADDGAQSLTRNAPAIEAALASSDPLTWLPPGTEARYEPQAQ